MQAREAAFLALHQAMKEESFISDFLTAWQVQENPHPKDFALAYEIAMGSCRRALTLDAIAKGLTPKRTLRLNAKEKALLRTALYQRYFMDKIPPHAICNETVKIAKKRGMQGKAGFFNAILRKSLSETVSLSEEDPEAFYSYPKPLVQAFVQAFGKEKSRELFEIMNLPPVPMARRIGSFDFLLLNSAEELKKCATSPSFYIQNSTPALLMQGLTAKNPHSILDLCASPGGKLLLAHALFPKAKLYANDVSEDKLSTLKENLLKYGLKAEIREGKGEEYPLENTFDMIIVDAPCSNTGVLHKRAEARWRYKPLQHEKLQLDLLKRAAKLLSPKGSLLYMTCSILPEENEKLVRKACSVLPIKLIKEAQILPNKEHADGGYAAELQLSSS